MTIDIMNLIILINITDYAFCEIKLMIREAIYYADAVSIHICRIFINTQNLANIRPRVPAFIAVVFISCSIRPVSYTHLTLPTKRIV